MENRGGKRRTKIYCRSKKGGEGRRRGGERGLKRGQRKRKGHEVMRMRRSR